MRRRMNVCSAIDIALSLAALVARRGSLDEPVTCNPYSSHCLFLACSAWPDKLAYSLIFGHERMKGVGAIQETMWGHADRPHWHERSMVCALSC
ncbi:hypothetical protein DFH29DRAFT_645789 [Suillus ampliporus]|nr:hypothetical protein DFH29DRAFT_645789 [Suillus ampliporus]